MFEEFRNGNDDDDDIFNDTNNAFSLDATAAQKNKKQETTNEPNFDFGDNDYEENIFGTNQNPTNQTNNNNNNNNNNRDSNENNFFDDNDNNKNRRKSTDDFFDNMTADNDDDVFGTGNMDDNNANNNHNGNGNAVQPLKQKKNDHKFVKNNENTTPNDNEFFNDNYNGDMSNNFINNDSDGAYKSETKNEDSIRRNNITRIDSDHNVEDGQFDFEDYVDEHDIFGNNNNTAPNQKKAPINDDHDDGMTHPRRKTTAEFFDGIGDDNDDNSDIFGTTHVDNSNNNGYNNSNNNHTNNNETFNEPEIHDGGTFNFDGYDGDDLFGPPVEPQEPLPLDKQFSEPVSGVIRFSDNDTYNGSNNNNRYNNSNVYNNNNNINNNKEIHFNKVGGNDLFEYNEAEDVNFAFMQSSNKMIFDKPLIKEFNNKKMTFNGDVKYGNILKKLHDLDVNYDVSQHINNLLWIILSGIDESGFKAVNICTKMIKYLNIDTNIFFKNISNKNTVNIKEIINHYIKLNKWTNVFILNNILSNNNSNIFETNLTHYINFEMNTKKNCDIFTCYLTYIYLVKCHKNNSWDNLNKIKNSLTKKWYIILLFVLIYDDNNSKNIIHNLALFYKKNNISKAFKIYNFINIFIMTKDISNYNDFTNNAHNDIDIIKFYLSELIEYCLWKYNDKSKIQYSNKFLPNKIQFLLSAKNENIITDETIKIYIKQIESYLTIQPSLKKKSFDILYIQYISFHFFIFYLFILYTYKYIDILGIIKQLKSFE